MATPRYPSLYQLNTRVLLTDLSRSLGRTATLDDIPDAEIDRLAEMGFDWVWLLSVWQTGPVAQQISRTNREWRHEFEETLPDLREDDIAGSGFAITGYTVHEALGGDQALARLRQRLRDRGLRLMLDFVPNHTAPDHHWVNDHPDYFVAGTAADLEREPLNYTRVKDARVRGCWHSDATRTSPAGPIRCNSITAIPPRKRPWLASFSGSRVNATGCVATWRC